MKIDASKEWSTALEDFSKVFVSLLDTYKSSSILELGGGRRPTFTFDELPLTVSKYTVNDISQTELDLVDGRYDTACFDVSKSILGYSDKYDFVFSRFLAEHVSDGRAMHQNIFEALRPGGISFHLIPTLYASPFLLNLFLPERLTHKLLTTFFPIRKKISPKFPAYYSWCFGDIEKMRRLFFDLGYSEIEIRSFYGHYYYDKIPVLRTLERALSAAAAKRNWTWYSSYAYIIARK